MSYFLFSEFDSVSSKQWKQKIQFDLKGADYNNTLIHHTHEAINVKPFYHGDQQETPSPIPGQPTHWRIGQDVFIHNEKIANQLALDAIDRGAEAIVFSAEAEFDIHTTLNEFPFYSTPVYFHLNFLSQGFVEKLSTFLYLGKATYYLNVDLIGNLVKGGNWFSNLTEDHKILDALVIKLSSENILSVNLASYQNAGANSVQQLAYALAHANEYLNHLDSSTALNTKELTMTFTVAVGGNYFMEIAKIRALRILYAVLAKEYEINESCHIVARPSKRNKTLYDYNVNMLRSTTECMSAVLGGANTICNLPYDALYHKSNEFGERIARNQLLILKSESYFDATSNPADGAYYIESLTNELTEKALNLFKEIESSGGFLKQLKEGIIQRKIKESAAKEQQQFDDGSLVLLGTNKHPNANDLMKDNLELFPFVKTNVRKTLIAPIVEKRFSEKMEQERIQNE